MDAKSDARLSLKDRPRLAAIAAISRKVTTVGVKNAEAEGSDDVRTDDS